MTCDYEGCVSKRVYCIEWWGLNQYGKNPEVADERYACSNPAHLIALSKHDEYGGYPDEINDAKTEEVKPRLLELVTKAMDGDLESDTIDNIVFFGDPPKEQLSLFPEY